MSTQSSTGVTPSATSSQDEPDYAAEIRFGVVMYGGVSLAIYINGVTNEIYELACATPREGVKIADPIDDGGTSPKTPAPRALYRRLSWLVSNADLRRTYANRIRAARQAAEREGRDWDDSWVQDDCARYTRTRFAVDVVAGTSAGGINGLFLAKALANGEQFAPLKDLWINEGDLSLLINDQPSYQDVEPPLKPGWAEPASLLNSDRMYAKLHYALTRMTPIEGVSNPQPGLSPLAEEIDLFVTTTDVRGTPVPLRLFDKVVYERRYKQSYHFAYPNGITNDGNDFAPPNTAFLAFAARCTSSFPFAFEPMTLATVTRLGVDSATGVRRFDGFFPNLSQAEVASGAHVDRAFGDGGYLDNKPFSYVVDALSKRFAAVPIERKLVFVEPAPEHLDPNSVLERPDPGDEPDALENSLAALTTIPQYETIREDLQAILARNRRIERIERVVQLGETAIRATAAFHIAPDAKKEVPDWASLGLTQMVAYYGAAYLPYQRLRIYAVTDALSDRIGARLKIDPEADQQYALRGLVRVWRDRHYVDEQTAGKETVNAFLDQFDFDYRVRRLGFLMRKVDVLQRLFRKRRAGVLDRTPGTTELSDEERQLLDYLPPPYRDLPSTLPDAELERGVALLRTFKRCFYEARRILLDADRSVDEVALDPDRLIALRKDLDPVLLGILGHASSATVPSPVDQREVQALDRATPPRLASTSRTLQEGIFQRAIAAYQVLPDGPKIEAWIGEQMDRLRVKGDPLAPRTVPSTSTWASAATATAAATSTAASISTSTASPTITGVSNYAMELLGHPRLSFVPGANGAVPVVGPVSDARFDAHERELLNSPEGQRLREFLAFYYLRFDSYDQISFPLYYDTGTGEPSTVEVVRVSPIDATNLIDEATDPARRKKLAGTALANFGAFLDQRWRLNDIMWGQLDGAERLIEALLPIDDDDTVVVRHELIERAHRHILQEALVPGGRDALADVVVKALAETASRVQSAEGAAYEEAYVALARAQAAVRAEAATGADTTASSSASASASASASQSASASPTTAMRRPTAAQAALATAESDLAQKRAALYAKRKSILRGQIDELFVQLARGTGAQPSTMASALDGLLDAPGLMEYVRATRRNDPDPDPEKTMKMASRAVTVTGRVLEGISQKRTGTTKMARWLARFGLMAQGVVAVSIPGSMTTQVWRHVMKVLYAFEFVLLGLAFLFGNADLRTLAISAFATTVALHLLTLIVGDVLRETRPRWLYAAGIALVVALVFFAGLGVLMVVHQGAQQALCWNSQPTASDTSWAARVCGAVVDVREKWNARFEKDEGAR